MGFGSGFGLGNPRWRAVRLGLFVAALLAAVLLHGHGRAYEGFRVLYYGAIVALLFSRFRRSRGLGSRGTDSGRRRRPGTGTDGSLPFYGSVGGKVAGPEVIEPYPGAGPPARRTSDRWPPPDPAVPPVDPPLGPAGGGG